MDNVRTLTLAEVDKRYRHCVTNLAAKYAEYVGCEVDKEDYVSYALIYMHRRQGDFRPEFNVPFDAWMYTLAKSEIRHRKRNDEYYLSHTTLVPEVRLDDSEDYTTWAENMNIQKALGHLRPLQRTVILRKYWLQESLSEIGKAMGIVPQRVHQLHHKALDHLRGELI